MRPLDEVREEVLAAVKPLASEPVSLSQARGRITARDAHAPQDVPPFPNSAMDGFAVRAADVAGAPVLLRIVGEVAAGSVAVGEVGPGTAIRIMTGAPMPPGADSVVKVELTHQPDPDTVEIREAVPEGTAIRPAGGDFSSGEQVVATGTWLGPVELALLATAGVGQPIVSRRPRVAVFATGDELREPEVEELAPGEIRDSNRPLMRALVEEAGGDVIDLGIVPDREEALTSALERAASEADAIVTSGGVSMGEYDMIKHVLTARGTVHFWQVAMQPAKPFGFGHVNGVPLFALPGNPVSVLVSFEQFARPALLLMQGAAALRRPRVRVRAGGELVTDPAKEVFVRVALRTMEGELVAASSGSQSSNVLSALGAADGLAVVPRGTARVEVGEMVEVELFRHPSREMAG
ncbi:MAG: gephyrin-like molybdotransferase Glp [Actinomycetota bacterium]